MDFGSNDIYIFFPFSLFVSVYVYASVCDFFLYSFAFTICPRVLFVCFFFFNIVLVIIRGFLFWFGCYLLSFLFFFYIK